MASSEKRCLYEVLGVDRDCTAEEIRSAYRKLALQRHPDKLTKSGVSEAEATAQFQELVNAYEVLSDARERAWYDSHRSQILFSSSAPSSNSSNIVPNIFSYFSNSVYSGYSDTGKGFYKVYADVFDKIYQNELNFAKKMGLGWPKEAPLMSNMHCNYDQVTAFYNYWSGFMTVMDFCWVDQYDVMAGPNRKSRRVMEEENKKLRKKARREYNETVRGLAEFVKKRDKRVIDMQKKREEEREKKRAEERERKKELERQKAERARMYEEPDWAKVEDFEDEEIDEELQENVKRKGDANEFYCFACGKKFKSDKQWKNHEQSKKHKERVAELREALEDEDRKFEDEHVDGGEDEDAFQEESVFLSADDEAEAEELAEEFKNNMGIQEDSGEAQSSDKDSSGGKIDDSGFEELQTETGPDEDEAIILEAMVSEHKSRKNVGPEQKHKHAAKNVQVEVESDEMDFMEYNNLKGTRSKRRSRRQRDRMPEGTEEADVTNTNRNIDDSSVPVGSLQAEDVCSHTSPADGINNGEVDSGKKHKVPKPAVKKKSTAKQENTAKTKEAPKGRKKKVSTKVSSNSCETCGEEFESRNKLHKHLGETGHSTLKSR